MAIAMPFLIPALLICACILKSIPYRLVCISIFILAVLLLLQGK